MSRLILAAAVLTCVATAAEAQQLTKPQDPSELAAASRMMAEKDAACRAQAKEQKLGVIARRKFMKSCRKG